MTDGETVQERLKELLERARPPTGGVSLKDIAAETAPVLPLLIELPAEEWAQGDYESFEFRECLTVLTLLGRRLALLDLTPTTAVQVVQLALRAVDESDEQPVGGFAGRAVAAAVEGFVLGREERVAQEHESSAAECVKPIEIDDGVFALMISGVHEAAVLSEHVDALGRAMLDGGAEIALVDLTQLGEPNRERAAAIFAADEVARMLGGVCFFCGVDARWTAAARDARVALETMQTTPDFASGLAAVREASGASTAARTPKWRGLLDRLRR